MNRTEAHAENVRRAKAMDDTLAQFGSRSDPAIGRSKSDVGARHIIDTGHGPATAQVQAQKADRASLHRSVRAIDTVLTANAARTLDLIVRKQEQIGEARLVNVTTTSIAAAIDMPISDVEAAKRELERLGFIVWYDDYSGNFGFRAKV
ncbi:hypothetical protein [Rhizobium laguerreae]|uniref:hypothetical protein n=1 Tax=Rhizobium laguerreae TaxID=1076926 RepID=UPI001C8FE83D|nr:hypothetical protein [Rhizobium laguerreae]MBY3199970.1 hypothetical protein [Rhizobium laguerreae]